MAPALSTIEAMRATRVSVHAPAKINWTLEVLGRRDDGYHEIRSVLQTIDLRDELEFFPADRLLLEAEAPQQLPPKASPPLAEAEADLILRAARSLGANERGALIRLRKRIPPAAGLGGGSSDAAATLRAVACLWGLPLSQSALADAAATLGSDVPFFLHGGTALAQGRGERVTPLPDAPMAWLVLVVPALSLPRKTAHMYANLSPSSYSDGSFTQRFLQRLGQDGAIDENLMHNAFERTAYAVFPDLAQYRQALFNAGARRVHLAGSGPALFALAREEEEARRLGQNLRLPDGQALVVRTLTRQEALGSEP